MNRIIPYGIMNYAELVEKNGYFIDKTKYIKKLETIQNPVFLRPRRFGKSLFSSMLQYYYDIREADRFSELFGSTWIGNNPTGNQNKYIVLKLDFSRVPLSDNIRTIEQNFNRYGNNLVELIVKTYASWFPITPPIRPEESVVTNLGILLDTIRLTNAPQILIIIDEYDNFSNQLLTSHQDTLYQHITTSDSFLRSFFKVLKEGRQSGSITNIFITGVLPITIDELASGYNIATFLTLDPQFDAMLGFTQTEVDSLINQVYHEYEIDPASRKQVNEVIKSQYNGYHFGNPDGEAVYNSTMVMFFLRDFCENKKIPKQLTDYNLRTDLSWVKRIVSGIDNARTLVTDLIQTEQVAYDEDYLVTKFNKSQLFDLRYFPVSFFYLGLLTKKDYFLLKIPNLNIQKIFTEYFNELNYIDVSTRYATMMQEFLTNPDLTRLFSEYWRLYVSQLPEAVFTRMNENFYRTTFYELCSRYLSTWFTWNVERSYPQGRSDLEFVGKYHEKFSDLRWIIEFKYFSNTEWDKMKRPIEEFQVREEDTRQIQGYAQGLAEEYPEIDPRLFVIYCIGNRGFRIFELNQELTITQKAV